MRVTCTCGTVLQISPETEGIVQLRCPGCQHQLRVRIPERDTVGAGATSRPTQPSRPSAPMQDAPSSEPSPAPQDDPLAALAYSVERAPAESRRLRPGKRTISVADACLRDRRRAELFEKRVTLVTAILAVVGLLSAVFPLSIESRGPVGDAILWPIVMSIRSSIWPLWLYWLAAGVSLAVGLAGRKLPRGAALAGIWGGPLLLSLAYGVSATSDMPSAPGAWTMLSLAILAASLAVLVVAHVRQQVRGGTGLRVVGAIAGAIVLAAGLWQMGSMLWNLDKASQLGVGYVAGSMASVLMLALAMLTGISAAAGAVCAVNSLLPVRRRKLSAVVLCLIYAEVGMVAVMVLVIVALAGVGPMSWVVWGGLVTIPPAGLLVAGLVATVVWVTRGNRMPDEPPALSATSAVGR